MQQSGGHVIAVTCGLLQPTLVIWAFCFFVVKCAPDQLSCLAWGPWVIPAMEAVASQAKRVSKHTLLNNSQRRPSQTQSVHPSHPRRTPRHPGIPTAGCWQCPCPGWPTCRTHTGRTYTLNPHTDHGPLRLPTALYLFSSIAICTRIPTPFKSPT